MPPRLRYEGTGLLVPKEIIAIKEKQLRFGIEQFMTKYFPFSTGIYIVFKWAFVESQYKQKKDITLFRIEVLNLSNGETQVRSWEMKDDVLISDCVYNHPRPFVLTGYLFADWYQDLFGLAINAKKNKSLEKALDMAANVFKLASREIEILDASCKINLAWGKEYGGLEYKVRVLATDSHNRVREYNWLLETDPLEVRYSTTKTDKSSPSPKKISAKTRSASTEVSEEFNKMLKAFKVTNYQGNQFKNLLVIGNNLKFSSPANKHSPIRLDTFNPKTGIRLFTPFKNTFYNRHQLNTSFDLKDISSRRGTEKSDGGSPVISSGKINHFKMFHTPINNKRGDLLNKSFGL